MREGGKRCRLKEGVEGKGKKKKGEGRRALKCFSFKFMLEGREEGKSVILGLQREGNSKKRGNKEGKKGKKTRVHLFLYLRGGGGKEKPLALEERQEKRKKGGQINDCYLELIRLGKKRKGGRKVRVKRRGAERGREKKGCLVAIYLL